MAKDSEVIFGWTIERLGEHEVRVTKGEQTVHMYGAADIGGDALVEAALRQAMRVPPPTPAGVVIEVEPAGGVGRGEEVGS